jgi:hypothetical protein
MACEYYRYSRWLWIQNSHQLNHCTRILNEYKPRTVDAVLVGVTDNILAHCTVSNDCMGMWCLVLKHKGVAILI